MGRTKTISDSDLAIRHFVFQHFVRKSRPPTIAETANVFGLSEEQTIEAFKRLHDLHFFFLEPGQVRIRMANPLVEEVTR